MASKSKRASIGGRHRRQAPGNVAEGDAPEEEEPGPAARAAGQAEAEAESESEGEPESEGPAEPVGDELAAFTETPEMLAALAADAGADVGGESAEAGAAAGAALDLDAPSARAGHQPPVSSSALMSYLQELRVHPLLDREEEHSLAVRYARTHDDAAARRLVTANLRLVVKISQEYRRAHKNLLDLIQEGNIGLIQAVQKYDPYRGVKLSSYAAWWIRAYILKFILANWRIVKIGTTQAQRKLFFNLRKEREKLEKAGLEVEARHLAAALDVSEQDVIDMERRLGSSETSLDSPLRSEEGSERSQGDLVPAAASLRPDVQVEIGEFQELLREKLNRFSERLRDRELDIFRERLLSDTPATLQEIGERYGVSRERARQIEERLKKKLRNFLQAEIGDAVDVSSFE